jgi:hypothetical protein
LDASWYGFSFSLNNYVTLEEDGVETYSSHSADRLAYAVNKPTRRSWCLLQPWATGKSFFLGKDIGTVPTNLLIVARLKFDQYYQSMTASDRIILLGMFRDSGGKPSSGGYAMSSLNNSTAGVVRGRFTVSGGSTNYTTDVDSQGQALEYCAVHKIGTTYHGWIGTAGGNWIYMGSSVYATYSLPHVGIYVWIATQDKPGGGVFGVDFIRFYETANFLF